MNDVFLVGFMGSGKSTVGRLVAEHLDLPFTDLDARIEAATGMTVSEIFGERGERGFRQLEHEQLGSLIATDPSVVASGGGVIVDDRNRVLLHMLGKVIYLRVSADEALARVGSAEGRPLLEGPDTASAARTLLAARERLYETVADVTVDTVGKTPAEVADEVVAAL